MGSSAGSLLGRVLPLAAAFIPGIGPVASAALGAAGGALSGGGLKGALLGGLGGGLTGGLGSSLGTAAGLGSTASKLFGSALGGAVGGAGGGLKSALMGGLTGAGANLAGSALSGGLGLSGGSSYSPASGGGAYGGGSSFSPDVGWIDWQPGNASDDLWGSLTNSNALGGLAKAGSTLLSGDQLLDSQDDSLAALKPYMQTGQLANSQLQGALQDGSLGGTFTPGDLTQDPGYQFRLQEGQKALDRNLGARGNLFSGAALKASQDYGQGLADQTYNDAYQRWLQGQNSRAGILGNAAGRGQQAAGSAAQIYDNMGNIKANTTMGLNNTFQQGLSGGGYYDDPNSALKRALLAGLA